MHDHHIAADERDFFKEPFTATELKRIIGKRPIADFISTRAKSYKTMGWDQKPPTKSEAIAAMIKDPTLLKRPILIRGSDVLIGFSQAAYDALTRKRG